MAEVERANRDPDKLDPALKPIAIELIFRARKKGLCVGLFEGYRSPERQDYLKSQGRSQVGGESPKAMHVQGKAVDIVFLDLFGRWTWNATHGDWQELGQIGEELGLIWGGSWTGFRDFPHFQLEA